MNRQLKREDEEIRSIGVKTPTAQTDKLPYRPDSVRQEEVNQQPRTSTTAYNFKIPQPTQFSANKPLMFRSRYINENGRWTQNAVNDGFVDIKDYISDIKNDEQGISFNGKEMKISNDYLFSYMDNEKASYNNNKNIRFKTPLTHTVKTLKYSTTISGLIDMYDEYTWTKKNLGEDIAQKAYAHGDDSLSKAEQKMYEWGLDSTWNNKADAYRHFMWNAQMTRDNGVGYYHARNVTNRHEYEAMRNNNWIFSDSSGFNYLKDNTIIKGKMNQESIMDLWNNQVGRELANNSAFSDKTEEELFNFAQEHDLLINDAATVYEKLGLTDYIANENEYTVRVEWNLTTGDIVVKKGRRKKYIKVGI